MKRFLCVLILTCAALLLVPPGAAWAAKLNIAVLDFENTGKDSELDHLSREIPGFIVQDLAGTDDLNILERAKLKKVIEEMAFQKSGVVDEGNSVKLGKIMGAEEIILGSFAKSGGSAGDRYLVSAKVVNVQRGEVMASWSFDASGKEDLRTAARRVAAMIQEYAKRVVTLKNLAELTQDQPSFRVELWTDKENYRVGDAVTIFFRSEKACYLTLIDMTTSGKVYVLYPNQYARDNFVAANQVYSVPGKDDGFAITVGGPKGVEKLKAIATLKRSSLMDMDFRKGGDLFKVVEEPERKTRDFNIVVTGMPKVDWSSAYREVMIE